MPKRVLDGEGLWRSDKLSQLPPDTKAEYANLIPLAHANGSFECSPRLVWTLVYAYNRPEITLERVTEVLDELERAKLLFRWNDNGKIWGFWVGIDRPGRLPSQSRQDGGHEKLGAKPPKDKLAAFLGIESSGPRTARHPETSGQPVANQQLTPGEAGKDNSHPTHGEPLGSQRVASGSLGLGSGNGTGVGAAPDDNSLPRKSEPEGIHYEPELDGAMMFERACSVFPKPERDHATRVQYFEAIGKIRASRKCSDVDAVNWLLGRITLYAQRINPAYAVGFEKFLRKEIYNQPETSWGAAEIADVPVRKATSLPLSERLALQRNQDLAHQGGGHAN